ncbi:MAG: DUF4168 domain-containing protein [Desulfonatronovibrionaceae bacterium]
MFLFTAFILTAAGSVYAQQQGQQQQGQQQQGQQQGQQMMQQEAPDIEVSDAELEKAAGAYEDITKIREEFQQSLSDVSDPEKAQALQEEAGEAMTKAVQDNGLEIQKYNQIMEAAQVDEDLRNKLLAIMEEDE